MNSPDRHTISSHNVQKRIQPRAVRISSLIEQAESNVCYVPGLKKVKAITDIPNPEIDEYENYVKEMNFWMKNSIFNYQGNIKFKK